MISITKIHEVLFETSSMAKTIHLYYIVLFGILLGSLLAAYLNRNSNNSTLELIHLFMRHGERHPDKVALVPNGPYFDEKYYPEGYGQLYNAGKRTEYNIGIYLRKRYDDFLGDIWNMKHLKATSSSYDRSKMSLQLALAGLYPPKGRQVWSHQLPWQPIPYDYVPELQDKEFLPFLACPKFKDLLNKIQGEPEMKRYLQRYDEALKILANKSNMEIGLFKALHFYFGFEIQKNLGYPLEKWTADVYPEPLHSLSIDMYYLITNTTEIRRVMTGYLLKKIIDDIEVKIKGTLDSPERKMFIYSGHEFNIAALLLTLGTQIKLETPPYGAYVLFEVHKIDGVFGIKMFYQDYKQTDPVLLKIGGCEEFCLYQEFHKLVEKYLPASDEECFGRPKT